MSVNHPSSTDRSDSIAPTITDTVAQTATRRLPTLTRPEHYLAVPLAVDADGDTGGTLIQATVEMPGELRLGARGLGLITTPDNPGDATAVLTSAGEAVVAHVAHSSEMSLDSLAEMSHRGRLITTHPEWGHLVQRVFGGHPLTRAVVSILPPAGTPVSLPELARQLYDHQSDLAMDCLLATAPPETAALETAEAYLSTATYQFKSALCHAGILTMPGQDSTSLTPPAQTWTVDPLVSQTAATAANANGGEH